MERKANIIYYTCNTHLEEIEQACRKQLQLAADAAGIPIISVSLNKVIDFGDKRITIEGQRSPKMMHEQILAGLMASEADYVYLCESDVLYHPSHFDFVPMEKDVYYYNTNVWKVKYKENLAVWTDNLRQVSGLCADKALLLNFYNKRVAEISSKGFDRRYEPRDKRVENYMSQEPNVCIRHDENLTASKWSPNDFRNKRFAKGWKEAEIPSWAKGLI